MDVSDDEVDAYHAKRLSVSADVEDSDSEDEREAVLDIAGSDSDSEVEADYEREKEVAKVGKAWGKKASGYYKQGDSEEESDEEEARKDEEEEALRIQKEQRSKLRDEDFELASMRKSSKSKGGSVVTLKKKKKKSKKSQVEQASAHAPELLGLLAEFNSSLKTLKEQVIPVVEKLKSGGASTQEGNSYLDAKFHIMLSYCINIAFYLLLKAEGSSVKDHPVIEELVRIRTTLEKLRPLDNKLKAQFNKVLQGGDSAARERNGSFKPSAADLVADSDDESEEEKESEKAPSRKQATYKIPKLAAVHFQENEREVAKAERAEKKMRERVRKSAMLNDLRDEFSERPKESSAVGTEDRDEATREFEEEKKRYEEANFVRLRETKQQKLERKKREKRAQKNLLGGLHELEDFEGMEALSKGKSASSRENRHGLEREEALRQFMRKVEGSSNSKESKKRKSGDELFVRKDPMVLQRRAREPESEDEGVFAGETVVAPEEEDEHYRQVLAKKRKKKEARSELFRIEKKPMHNPVRFVEDGDTREATYKILKNRGLTAHKKREDRNPRVKMRKKYEKKMRARKGQVREIRAAETTNYVGESSGLRVNLVRSRKPGKK